jgi:inner membrane protein
MMRKENRRMHSPVFPAESGKETHMDVISKVSEQTRRFSVVLKVVFIAALLLVMLIPLAMIGSLVRERESRREGAESEIFSSWGGRQTIAGPILTVPYLEYSLDSRGRRVETVRYARFLPQTLSFEAAAEPGTRSRGIYDVTVYTAGIKASGAFRRPDFGGWRIDPKAILWNAAFLSIELPDMRAIQSRVTLSWGRLSSSFETASSSVGILGASGEIRAAVPALGQAGTEPIPFSFNLTLRGGDTLSFLPLGEETVVHVTSPWRSPSFNGAFLPATRTLADSGFAATWKILSMARIYPQRWRAAEIEGSALGGSTFGVSLMAPVDSYQKVTRAVKYGIVFLLLPFLTLFLFEVFSRSKFHPLQYIFVGFAECIFYLLLLSLSEHVPFWASYLAAAGASVGLITIYTHAIARGSKMSLVILPILCTAYGFLYLVLRSEDYALLVGSLGLFIILAAVMMLTRRIDWYGVKQPRTVGGEQDGAS